MASILNNNPLTNLISSNRSKYNRYTSEFKDYAGSFTSNDDKYLDQSTAWDDAVFRVTGKRPKVDSYLDMYKREMRNRYLDSLQNARRGGLDRTIDALSTFNYGIAGFAKGFVDNDDEFGAVTPLQGLVAGLKAGNPFGQGNVRGETLFSDVLESGGWKPDSTLGKIAKGTVGFALDVALDPSTYLTFGVGAAVKGTGRAGANALARNVGKGIAEREGIKFRGTKKLADDVYDNTIKKFSGTNVNPALAERLAESKMQNTLNGLADIKQTMTVERATEIVTDRMRRNGTLSKTSPEQVVSDATNFASTFNRAMGYDRKGKGITLSLGNVPFGDKIFGKKAATPSLQIMRDETIRKLADKGLGRAYAKARNAFYGSKLGKLFSTQTNYVLLSRRDPTELYNIMKFTDITRGLQYDKQKQIEHIHMMAKGFNMSPAEEKQILNLMQDESQWRKIRPIIELRHTEDAEHFRREIQNAQTVLRDKIDELNALRNDVDTLSAEKVAQARVAERTLESLKDERAFKLLEVDTNSTKTVRELETQLESLREQMRNLVKAEEDASKAIVEPNVVQKTEAIFEQAESLRLAQGWRGEEFNELVDVGTVNRFGNNVGEIKSKLTDSLNDVLYNGEKVLSAQIHPDSLRDVADRLRNNSLDDIRRYIAEHPKMFTAHAREAQNIAANIMKYKDWNEVYTAPMEGLVKMRNSLGQLSEAGRIKFDQLTALRTRREALLDVMYKMTPSELIAFKTRKMDEEMAQIMDDAELLFNSTGYSAKTTRELEYERFINPDRKNDTLDADDYVVKRDAETGEEYYGKGVKDEVTGKLAPVQRGLIERRAMELMSGKKLFDKTYEDMAWDGVRTPIQNAFLRDVSAYASNNLVTFYKKEFDDLTQKQVESLINHSVNKALHEKGYFGFGKVKKKNVNINVGNQISYVDSKTNQIKLGTIAIYNKETGDIVVSGKAREDGIPSMRTIKKTDIVPTTGNKARAKLNAEMRAKVEETKTLKAQEDAKQKVQDTILARMEVGSSVSFRNGKSNARGSVTGIDGDSITIITKLGTERVVSRADIVSVGVKKPSAIDLMRADEGKVIKQLNDMPHINKNAKNVLSNEYAARIAQQERLIDELNDTSRILAESLRSGDMSKLDSMSDEVEKLEDLLSDADAFESYMRLTLGEGKIADILNHASNKAPAKFAFDADASYSEKVKSIAKTLRQDFIDIANKEVSIGKLKQEQVDSLMMRYVPHILTPEGKAFFTGKSDDKLKAMGVSLGKDYGYGVRFNPHGKERKVKLIKLNGEWVHNPNISQLNEYFAPYLNGKNAYLDNLSDLYISRMLKHTDLMYDDHYMRNMMNVFGKAINADGSVDKGFKAVMNHGMMREFVSESAGMIVSMRIGRMVSDHLRNELSGRSGSVAPEQIKEMIETFLKANVTPEIATKFREEAMGRVLTETRIGSEMLGNFKLPMAELDEANIAGMKSIHDSIKSEFSDVIFGATGRYGKAVSSGDEEYIARVLKDIAKLEGYKPAQIVQVNDAIVHKANQARKIQIAKDEARFLQLYDKMTHLIKLNMTTIVPSFHMRNLVANTYLNWLNIGRDAMDAKLHSKALSVVRSAGQKVDRDVLTIKNPDGSVGTITWSELYSEAKALNVIDEGFFAKDIGAYSQTKGLLGKVGVSPKFDPTDSENFLPYKWGGRVGNTIENTSRLTHFAALLRSGVDSGEAARQVREFLFDYSDLTRFEQSFMKRIIPFYTWLRKNGALQLNQLLENTERMQLVAKTFNGVEGMNNNEDMIDARYLSNFAEDWIQTPFSTINEFGNKEPILWSPNLPINDLSRIPDPFNLRKTIESLFSQSNAIFKAPIEQVMNHQVFFDSPITEEGDSVGTQIGKRANHIASHNAAYNTLKSFFKKSGVDGNLNLLASTTGVKFSTYDVQGYIRNHLLKEGRKKDVGLTELTEFIGDSVSSAWKKTAYAVQDSMPKPADAYTGALRPISQSAYQKLSEKEKALYTPPTFSQAYAMNKQALAMEKEARDKAGVAKKFLWAVFDGVGEQGFEIGNVESVIDGDTFEIRVGNKVKTVRMLLVDTPESVKSNTPVQPFGVEASNYSKRRLMEKDVKIVFDGSKMDDYERTLAYVELPAEGVDYNEELIESGLAVKGYEFQDNYRRGRKYDEAQSLARDAERGVWSVPGYADNGAGNFDVSAYQRYLERNK